MITTEWYISNPEKRESELEQMMASWHFQAPLDNLRSHRITNVSTPSYTKDKVRQSNWQSGKGGPTEVPHYRSHHTEPP